MAVVTLHPSSPRATAAAITRWMRMIELHGGLDPDMLLQDESDGARPR
jgi:hypothetical protein